MASRRGLSYKWRFFLPVVISLWSIVLGMAVWQIYKIKEIKRDMVYDQLRMVGERIADLYNLGDARYAQRYMGFINTFYQNDSHYDQIGIQVRDSEGNSILNIGNIIPEDFVLPYGPNKEVGMYTFKGEELNSTDVDTRFLYYVTKSSDNKFIYVMLPYSNEVARTMSASTTRFWLVLFCIAIFATGFAYISTHFISRNIMILRDFARNAAANPEFMSKGEDTFPHDELGEISRQIVHIYNQRIEEMHKREREHQVALHAIDEKDRIKRELTANINHELKTPVGVIQGYIDTMVDNPDMSVETRDRFLFKTQDSVHRLSALIQDITQLTRLDNKGTLGNLTVVNFHDLAFSFENFLRESNVLPEDMSFSFDLPLNCLVQANEQLLQAVLLNLTKNAAAYSHGTLCRLEMTAEDEDTYTFVYYDDGVGVAPEHLPHMFDRFYRVNAGRSRDTGGTGLGLSIVEVTIKSFGGKISISNRHPSGLQFTFTLLKYNRKNESNS